METIKIFKFPPSVMSDKDGYSYLALVVNDIFKIKEEIVYFDLSECNYLECNLCSILGSALQDAVNIGKKFFMNNVEKTLKRSLQNIGFLEKDSETQSETDSNQVIYSRFKIDDPISIIAYVESKLLARPGLPLITDDLKKEIARNILEIYINAVTHGECQYVYSCGYVNKRSTKAELHFTLVDIGHTIKKNVNHFLKEELSATQCIQWATDGYNTTKINKTGGLGLKLMKQFLRNNDGKMQIVSGDGFWEFNKESNRLNDLKSDFPGTIVNIIFNLKDTKVHYLDSETSPSVSEIF